MKLISIKIHRYFHMIPLWKSPIKLPVELPVDPMLSLGLETARHQCHCPVELPVELPVDAL